MANLRRTIIAAAAAWMAIPASLGWADAGESPTPTPRSTASSPLSHGGGPDTLGAEAPHGTGDTDGAASAAVTHGGSRIDVRTYAGGVHFGEPALSGAVITATAQDGSGVIASCTTDALGQCTIGLELPGGLPGDREYAVVQTAAPQDLYADSRLHIVPPCVAPEGTICVTEVFFQQRVRPGTVAYTGDPFVAVPDEATSDGRTITIDVLANDLPADQERRILAIGQPGHGTAEYTLEGEVGTLVMYTPEAGFVGTDTFTYTMAALGLFAPVTTTVTVTVTAAAVPAVVDPRQDVLAALVRGTYGTSLRPVLHSSC